MTRIKDNTNELIKQLEGIIQKKLLLSAVTVERVAKQICPRRTGRLARSITRELQPRKAIIGTNVDYGPIVELGSRPHIIEPSTAKALWWKGAEHPVKVVHHPGTRPQPFLRPALEQSISEIKRIFSEP